MPLAAGSMQPLWCFVPCAGNMGNMPLVLLSAVCSDARNPFGNRDQCNKPGTAYIALGMWVSAGAGAGVE